MRPVLQDVNSRYEIGERAQGIGCGGIGAIHKMVGNVGLAKEIDRRLHLLKFHVPYHESDHILNIAYNLICGGRVLDDIEQRRNDPAFLAALGTQSIPDPTTAGDFCRRCIFFLECSTALVSPHRRPTLRGNSAFLIKTASLFEENF
ncbi:MAG: hypothetical protein GY847_27430 [Proteobacteria bacterium]|nr:hypothetical protein [Pseudomonadota bacterium]